MTIHLANGKDIVIKTPETSENNKFIQSATLNGKNFKKPWITHKDITSGGILILRMGPEPNRLWGILRDAVPPSLSKPRFKFQVQQKNLKKCYLVFERAMFFVDDCSAYSA